MNRALTTLGRCDRDGWVSAAQASVVQGAGVSLGKAARLSPPAASGAVRALTENKQCKHNSQ